MKDTHIPLARSFEPEQVMDTLAKVAGIDIPESSRQTVADHLWVAAKMADLVYAVPLARDTLEMAPVFTPGTVGRSKS